MRNIIHIVHMEYIQCESKKFIPLRFSETFFQWLRIFKHNFTCLLYVHIYAKWQNFIQLPLHFTKLCHIKHNHPDNLLQFLKQSSVKLFLYKVHIICSKCPPPPEAHAFRRLRKSLPLPVIALLILVCSKSYQICCSALLSSGIVLGFEWSSWNAWSIAPHTW